MAKRTQNAELWLGGCAVIQIFTFFLRFSPRRGFTVSFIALLLALAACIGALDFEHSYMLNNES